MVQARKQQGGKGNERLSADRLLKELKSIVGGGELAKATLKVAIDGLEIPVADLPFPASLLSGGAFEGLQPAIPKACHQLPSEAEAHAALAAFDAAVAAAEAAQEQLMRDSSSGSSSSSSPLAQLLAADPQLFKVAEAYTELQWLHHMAIQEKLQQYGPIAATLPGFAYACVAQAQGQANTKQPGDSIGLLELYSMSGSASKRLDKLLNMFNDSLPGGPAALKDLFSDSSSNDSSSPLMLLAGDLFEMLASDLETVPDNAEQQQQQQLLSDLRLLVLPDLGTLLLESLDPAAAAAGGQLPSTARQDAQPTSSTSDSDVSGQLVALLLQQGLAPPAPGSTPFRIEQPLDDFVAALGGMR
jgi:hypothetical protein